MDSASSSSPGRRSACTRYVVFVVCVASMCVSENDAQRGDLPARDVALTRTTRVMDDETDGVLCVMVPELSFA